jgi:hypothetical protein
METRAYDSYRLDVVPKLRPWLAYVTVPRPAVRA